MRWKWFLREVFWPRMPKIPKLSPPRRSCFLTQEMIEQMRERVRRG